MPLPPYDKCLHFLAGQLAALLTLALGLPWSCGLVLALAVGKEVYDFYHPAAHTCDVLDALATLCGGLPVWGLALVLHH